MEGNESNIKLLTVKDLSQESGIPISTIYKLVESEQIPYVRINKGREKSKVYFRRIKIMDWLEQSEVQPHEFKSFNS